MKTISASALFLTVIAAVMCSWIQARWPTSIPEAAVFTLAAVWAVAGITGLVKLRFHPILLLLALIVVWGAIQIGAGTTANSWRTKAAMLDWGCNLATFFVSLQLFSSSRTRVRFLRALIYFGMALSILSPLQELYGGEKVLWLFNPSPTFIPQFGPFPYRNQYSAFIELLLPIALFRAFTEERDRLLHVLAAALFYASVIAAGSRMGVVIATSEMLIVPLIIFHKHRLRVRSLRNNALLFGAIFIMLIMAAGPAEMLKKFNSPDPYAGRREYSESSLKMIRARPWMGFGLGNWATVYPGYALFDDGLHVNQAHDDWVQWGAEGGLPLLAIMVGIAAWTFRQAFRTMWGIGAAAVFVHCLVDYPIQRISVSLVMFLMLAALAAPATSQGLRSDQIAE